MISSKTLNRIELIISSLAFSITSCAVNLRNIPDFDIGKLCEHYFEEGLYDLSLDYCKEAIERGDASAYFLLGNSYLEIVKESVLRTPTLKESRNFSYYRNVERSLRNAIDSYYAYVDSYGYNRSLIDSLGEAEDLLEFQRNEEDWNLRSGL